MRAELNRMTLEAYKACRCSGVVRVDFIVTPEGKPYMIEINSIPGMSAGSIVPKQVRCMGMTLGELGVTVGRSDMSAKGQLAGYLGYLLRGDKLSGRLYVRSGLLDLNEIMAAMPLPGRKLRRPQNRLRSRSGRSRCPRISTFRSMPSCRRFFSTR